MIPTMQGFVEDAMCVSQGNTPISTEGVLVISGPVRSAWAYRRIWSTNRSISLPALKIICKYINLKWRW